MAGDIENATRPIIGIENRTPQEVFDIMSDRIKALYQAAKAEALTDARNALAMMEHWPDDLDDIEFAGGVFESDELGFTEMILKDVATFWKPWGPPEWGHAIDLGYDEEGHLVAIKIWDRVSRHSKDT